METTALTKGKQFRSTDNTSVDEQTISIFHNPMFANLQEIAFSVKDNRLVLETENDFQKCIDFLALPGDKIFLYLKVQLGLRVIENIFTGQNFGLRIYLMNYLQL